MADAAIPDKDFIELFQKYGAAKVSEITGVNIRNINKRRSNLEKKYQINIPSPVLNNSLPLRSEIKNHPARLHLSVDNGVVIIGSDSHYWPGEPSTAHRAFIHFIKELQPKVVIKNGDELDGATISRFAPIGWEQRPKLIQELEITQERLDEIVKAWKGAKHIWPLGNHDARFETRLATIAPEYAKIHGVHLKDHFPGWQACWDCWINDDVVVKHRFKGGIHATRNNTLNSGKTIITGHLHSLKVTPLTDYNGTRWGVDCGCIADPSGPQFLDYTENNPKDWRSGFVVLTFHNKRLLWPEVVYVIDEDHVSFRGKVIEV